jgi:hypothetical protein
MDTKKLHSRDNRVSETHNITSTDLCSRKNDIIPFLLNRIL